MIYIYNNLWEEAFKIVCFVVLVTGAYEFASGQEESGQTAIKTPHPHGKNENTRRKDWPSSTNHHS